MPVALFFSWLESPVKPFSNTYGRSHARTPGPLSRMDRTVAVSLLSREKLSTGFSSAYFTLLLTTCPSRKHSPRRSAKTVSSVGRISTRKPFSSSSGR